MRSLNQNNEHHNERYTDPGEEGFSGTVADYGDWGVVLRPARSLRPGDRLMGGSTIVSVDPNLDGYVEAVLDNGKTALFRATSDVPVEVAS